MVVVLVIIIITIIVTVIIITVITMIIAGGALGTYQNLPGLHSLRHSHWPRGRHGRGNA